MIKGYQVANMLRPNGGFIQVGDDYEGIEFIQCEPFTKNEYIKGFETVSEFIENESKMKQKAKAALLAKLGITPDEAALLLA
jgi:uncharacterized protein YqgQ